MKTLRLKEGILQNGLPGKYRKRKVVYFSRLVQSGTLVHNVREKSVYFSCAFFEKSVNLR